MAKGKESRQHPGDVGAGAHDQPQDGAGRQSHERLPRVGPAFGQPDPQEAIDRAELWSGYRRL